MKKKKGLGKCNKQNDIRGEKFVEKEIFLHECFMIDYNDIDYLFSDTNHKPNLP